jgi:hypothetical protein
MIPAGMTGLHRIPQESSGMGQESSGMGLESTGMNEFLQEWDGYGLNDCIPVGMEWII